MQPSANQYTQPQNNPALLLCPFCIYTAFSAEKYTLHSLLCNLGLILLSAQGLGLSQLPRTRPLHIGDPKNDMNSDAATLFTEVNAVSIRLPLFSPNGALTWF